MLTKSDLWMNQQVFKLLSKSGCFPFTFDSETWTVEPVTNLWQWKLHCLFILLNYIFKLGRLVQSLLFPERYFKLHAFFLHVIYLVFNTVLMIATSNLFQNRDEFRHLLNRIYKRMPEKIPETNLNIFEHLRQCSLEELLIIFLPPNLSTLWVGVQVVSFLDGNQAMWYLSLVPKDYQNLWTVVVCGCLDIWLISEIYTILYFRTYIALLFPMPYLCNNVMESFKTGLAEAKSSWSYYKTLVGMPRKLTVVWLEMKRYNEHTAGVVYCTKLNCLLISIFGIFVGVRFFHAHPIISSILLSVAVDTMILFSCLYGRLYLLPEMLAKLKNLTLKDAWAVMGPVRMRLLKKQLQALPRYSLRAGAFYDLDRTSTPEFVDYVVNQVVSLLVMFNVNGNLYI